MINKSAVIFIIIIVISSIILISCTKLNTPTGFVGVEVVEDIEQPKIWFEISDYPEPYEGAIQVQVHYSDFFGVSYAQFYVNGEQQYSSDWHPDYHGFNVNTTNYEDSIIITALVEDEFGNVNNAGPDTLLVRKPEIEIIENEALNGAEIGRLVFDESKTNMWLCTDIGLVKTNLLDYWQVFNTSNSNIQHNQVNDVITISDNLIYVGTGYGLCSFDGNNWTQEFEYPFGYPILSLEKGDDNLIWVGTNHRLYQYDGSSYENMQINYDMDEVYEIKKSKDGVYYFGIAGGLFELDDNGDFILISRRDEDLSSFDFSNDLGIWYVCDEWLETTSGYYPENELRDIIGDFLNPRKVFVDSRNTVWVTIDEGLLKYKGELWSYYNHLNSDLPNCYLNYIVEDIDGNILITTNDGKIVKILQ